MHGDVAARAHAERADLAQGLGPDPDAGGRGIALAGDAEARERAQHDLLEQAHVAVDADAQPVQVEDRIRDQLAGAVIGDVAAAVGLTHRNPRALEHRRRGEQVRRRAGAPGDRDHRIVLEHEQVHRFCGAAVTRSDHALMQRALHGKRLVVADAAEILDDGFHDAA